MNMFKNPEDEERLCRILKIYVEEWGPENVIVCVPEEWKRYNTSSLGQVRLEFSTRSCVAIRVEYETQCRINYNVQLQTI